MNGEYFREYYKRHRARILARVKARAIEKRAEIRSYKHGWQQKNSQRIKDQKATKYQRHKAAILAKQAISYAANPEPAKARAKAYRSANPDKAKAAVQSWCKSNPARLRAAKSAWQRRDYQRQSEKYREYQLRRKAQKLKTQTEKINFKKVLKDSNGVCGICRQPFDLFGIDFDHIVPLARGGTHKTENIQATHSRCNRSKGAKVG